MYEKLIVCYLSSIFFFIVTSFSFFSASAKCEECEDHLCQECVKAHKRMKITKNHTLIPIEGALNTSANRSVTASIGMYSNFEEVLLILRRALHIHTF